jgi:hypothetical protein
MGDFGGISEYLNANRNVESKLFQLRTWILLGIGLETMHIVLWQTSCLHFVLVLRL